jgi:osmotically-inducible protein OsmY
MPNRWERRDRSDFDDERDKYRDRGVASRAGDEVRSWFGDEEAAARRRMDELRDARDEGDWRDGAADPIERDWGRTREAMRRARDRASRGMGDWSNADRHWEKRRESGPYYGPRDAWRETGSAIRDADWKGERGFGDSRYATSDPHAGRSSPTWNRPSPESRVDWQSYSGRGPRGYRRADERIREEVCDWLTEDPRIDASDIEVEVREGEVTLAGSVRTREEKRFTEDVVERVMGVREVNNNLKVRPPDEVLGTARSGASMLGLTETPPPEPSPKTKPPEQSSKTK